MITVLDHLESGDLCSAVLLAALLSFVGQKMVEARPSLRLWGIRLAAVAFISYSFYRFLRAKSPDVNDLLAIAAHGLLVGGLTLGAAWIALAVLAVLYDYLAAPFWASVGNWATTRRRNAAERKVRLEKEARLRREQEEYARSAPERERARREADTKAKDEAVSQQRRHEARAACELLYCLHAPEIGPRFSRQMFDDFVARHLGDSHPPDEVERRARQLQDILRQHLEKVEPSPKRRSIEDRTAWYQETKQTIEALPIEDRAKRVQIAELNVRYMELMKEHLEGLEP